MTRNMLSQLENDLALPSVKTLRYLADTLGVSVGWLLEEKAACSEPLTEDARRAYGQGDYRQCMALLRTAERELSEEEKLLLCRSALECARLCYADGKLDETEHLIQLSQETEGMYVGPWERLQAEIIGCRCSLARGNVDRKQLEALQTHWQELPLENELHLLWTQYYMRNGQTEDAEHHLSLAHMSEKEMAEVWLLRGQISAEKQKFDLALKELHQAERLGLSARSQKLTLYRLLERCYKEREDYRMAYRYASLRLDET